MQKEEFHFNKGKKKKDLSAFDERMAAIIGHSSLSGIIERSEVEQIQHGNFNESKKYLFKQLYF